MLTLIRGLPGSGKSTVAKTLAQDTGAMHVETDMFFIDETTGAYHFDTSRLAEAHRWCQQTAEHALSHGVNVIVSNTFSQRWELQPYLDMAAKYNVKVQLIEVQCNFGNIHNVPQETIEKMRARWEPITL
jgi:predicted kinase